MIGHLRLVHQKHGDAIAHGINPAAAGALQKAFIRGNGERFAALGHGTYQSVEQFLQHHHSILKNLLLMRQILQMALSAQKARSGCAAVRFVFKIS